MLDSVHVRHSSNACTAYFIMPFSEYLALQFSSKVLLQNYTLDSAGKGSEWMHLCCVYKLPYQAKHKHALLGAALDLADACYSDYTNTVA